MTPIHARVIACDCDQCRDALLTDCRESSLPPPTDTFIVVPDWWANHECEHGRQGITMRFDVEVVSLDDVDDIWVSAADAEMVEAPDGWQNLDATKGIGYPAREQGRYGSHPSHDRFDGDSDP
jgi:hypothetical protein